MEDNDLMLKKLRKYLHSENLIANGDKILVALSGGADSTALLYLLSRLRAEKHLSLLAVHINHQLRGEASIEDEIHCKELCQKLNIPLIIRKINLNPRAALEAQGREKRFELFNQVLGMYRFDKIATAHHKNDQAETILMNLIRGTGINGMAGIKPVSGNCIHPLLCFKKNELIDLLNKAGLEWKEDQTNLDIRFRRNKIRNVLIPMIENDYNPAFVDRLSLEAETFRKTDKLLINISGQKLKRALLDQKHDSISLSIKALQKISDVERFYILKKAFGIVSGSENDFFLHSYEEIMSIFTGSGSKQISLQKGVLVKKQYDELIILSVSEESAKSSSKPLICEPDRNIVLHMDYRFTFKHLKIMPHDPYVFGSAHSVVIDADKVYFPLSIRSRISGDRFMPLGMSKSKRVKEFFIDEKVPKFERDKVPIIADMEKIVWIVGHRIDERVKCDETSTRYLHITAEPVTDGRKRSANRKKSPGGTDEYNEL